MYKCIMIEDKLLFFKSWDLNKFYGLCISLLDP